MTREELRSMNRINNEFIQDCNRVVNWFEKIDPTKGCVDEFFYNDHTNEVYAIGSYIMFSADKVEIEYYFSADLLFMTESELKKYFYEHREEILQEKDEHLRNTMKEHIENLKAEVKRLEEEYEELSIKD